MGNPIVYDYNAASATLSQTKTYLSNMEITVSDAMSDCTKFFENMDAKSREAMKSNFLQVIKSGRAVVEACQKVNIATTQAVEAMSETDSGQISRFI